MHVRTTRTLTYSGAQAALEAGLAQAEKVGIAVNVAVVDGSGVLIAFARMDGAFAHSADIAQDKARTVVGFGGAPTDGLYAAIEGEPSVRDGISGREGMAVFAGGMPIFVGDELVGAVGVSGGSASQDKEIAAAAAGAVKAS